MSRKLETLGKGVADDSVQERGNVLARVLTVSLTVVLLLGVIAAAGWTASSAQNTGPQATIQAQQTTIAKLQGTVQARGKKINAQRTADGKAIAEGEQALQMSDFGIKPPSFMFGRIKVGNEIKVKFNMKAGPELLAQLAAAYDAAGR